MDGIFLNKKSLRALFNYLPFTAPEATEQADREIADKRIVETLAGRKDPGQHHGSNLEGIKGKHVASTTKNANVIDELNEFLPEFSRDEEIIVPSIFGPDSMTPDSANISATVPANVDATAITTFIQEEILTKYELIDLAVNWVGDALYRTGATPVWICPETAAASGTEASVKAATMGTLEGVVLENTATNAEVKKSIGKYLDLHICTEDVTSATAEGINLLRVGGTRVLDTGSEEDSVSRYIRKLPTSAVIPLTLAGDEQTHLGYLVALDENRRPLKPEYLEQNRYDTGNRIWQSHGDFLETEGGKESVIAGLLNAGLSGTFLKDCTVSENAAALNLAFEASMRKLKVSFIYVPKEDMAYFAFRYRKDGTGMALPEKVLQLGELRLMSIVGNVVSGIDNSAPKRVVTLDGKSNVVTNPIPLIEGIRDVFSKGVMPSGEFNPSGIMSRIRRAATEVTWPEVDGLTGLSLDVSERSNSRPEMDSGVIETLAGMIRGACDSPASMLSEERPEEFAKSIVSNHLLLGNKIHRYQKVVNRNLTKIVLGMAKGNSELKTLVANAIEKRVGDDSQDTDTEDQVKKIISSITVTLPKPRLAITQSQIDELETIVQKLRTTSEGIFPETLVQSEEDRELNETYKKLRENWVREAIIDWLTTSGVSAGLSKTAFDQDDIAKISTFYHVVKNAQSAFKEIDKLGASDSDSDSGGGGSRW